jgi:energy-coupling factor transport system ATP-binding protein
VEEDVAFAPENLGIPPEEIRMRVDDALRIVGMYEMREHAPHLLSGGQKQRVAIAGVLAMSPKCVVFDEPTAMLDPQGRQDVIRTIRRLRDEMNVTVVLITHHMERRSTPTGWWSCPTGRSWWTARPRGIPQCGIHCGRRGWTCPRPWTSLRAQQMRFPLRLDALSWMSAQEILPPSRRTAE